jgi:hypothetical protein
MPTTTPRTSRSNRPRAVTHGGSEPTGPFSLPATTHSYLARAAESRRRTCRRGRVVPTPTSRPRAAAGLLATRARPASSSGQRRAKTPGCCWPRSLELTGWATFFAAAPPRAPPRQAPPARGHRARAATWSRRRPVPGRGRAGAGLVPASPRPSCASGRATRRTRRLAAPGVGTGRYAWIAVHLHGVEYSRQYGASHPHALVRRAAEHEMDTLALTDRDGTYGAVKHRACRAYDLRPVQVDLAVRPVISSAGQSAGRGQKPRTPCAAGHSRRPAGAQMTFWPTRATPVARPGGRPSAG